MLNQRQLAILEFIKTNKSATREQVQTHISNLFDKSSKITLLRDLDKLIDDSLIVKSGKTKSAEYSISPKTQLLDTVDVEAYFDIDPDKRELINDKFSFGIWEHLNGLLSPKEKLFYASLNQKYVLNRSKLPPAILHKELERLTIELAWKSSKIEGNTYSLLDTERLLKENVSAKGKTNEETQMIINHKKALDYILAAPEHYKELSIAKIEEIHSLLVDNLNVSKGVRQNMVGIVGTNYKPLDNAYQIKEALKKLIEAINATEDPLEKALIAVLMIAYIQPFEDGNKRTSRILGNALLLANNYCPLSYRSVDEVEYKKGIILFYEQNNASYFKQLFLEQFTSAVEKYF